MRDFDLRTLQLKELDILKELDRICKKNDITYYLAWGSCIGAVRHQGFIPWDDDIDVCMPMNDFKKFKKICATELKSPYFYQDMHTDINSPFSWAKIRNTQTCSMIREMANFPHNWGICIDIFPLVELSKPTFTKIDKLLYKTINLCVNKRLNDYGFGSYGLKTNKMKHIPMWLCIFIRNLCFKIFTRNRRNSKYYYDMSVLTEAYIFPKEWFKKTIELQFEDQSFTVMENYDAYLSRAYGDYMKIPEKHEQVDHGDIIVDFENSYKKYMKVEEK